MLMQLNYRLSLTLGFNEVIRLNNSKVHYVHLFKLAQLGTLIRINFVQSRLQQALMLYRAIYIYIVVVILNTDVLIYFH